MGENQEINTSLDFSSFDYTKLEELIKENQEQQKLLEEQQVILSEVLETQKKLVDYFVPTEEEILKKEELEKEQLLKEEELQKELEEEDLQKQKELEREKNLEQEGGFGRRWMSVAVCYRKCLQRKNSYLRSKGLRNIEQQNRGC